MARINGDSSGVISGIIGPVVFYNVKGKQYGRAAARKRSEDSWSSVQIDYRQKVKQTAAFWKQLEKNILRQSWGLAAVGMTGYNLFVKTNLPAFVGAENSIDLERAHLSFGPLPLPLHLNAVAAENDPSKWTISWKDDSGIALSKADDELMVIFAQEGKFSAPVATGSRRNQQSALVQVPGEMQNLKGMYLSFASADRKLYSVDRYVSF